MQSPTSPAGAVLRKLGHHGDEVRCVDFSPDGKMLASGSEDSTVVLSHAETGTPRGLRSGTAKKSPGVSVPGRWHAQRGAL